MQRIDPKVEKPTRDLLAHAIRGELEEMGRLVYAVGDQRYLECISLCITIAGYLVIDIAERWPTDADLREIARRVSQASDDYDLDESAVFEFLSRVVYGPGKLDEVFPDISVSTTLPVLATAQILLTFRPGGVRDLHWWEYLDVIERATEQAAALDPAVLPALMFLVRNPKQPKTA